MALQVPRRVPLSKWSVKCATVPALNEQNQWQLTDIVRTDGIRYENGRDIEYGRVRRIRHAEKTFIFECTRFLPGAEPKTLILTDDVIDVRHTCILNKILILHERELPTSTDAYRYKTRVTITEEAGTVHISPERPAKRMRMDTVPVSLYVSVACSCLDSNSCNVIQSSATASSSTLVHEYQLLVLVH